MTEKKTRCGYVAIIGRPNVGKSTLLNKFLGVHLAATANKPQTTRNRILGILSGDDLQVIFVDTPGIHRQEKRLLNKKLNRAAHASIYGNDLVLFVIEADRWTGEDDLVIKKLATVQAPVLLVINKIDTLAKKETLLPFLETVQKRLPKAELVPVSAFDADSVDYLLEKVISFIPEGDFVYERDAITDRPMRFHSAELVREQLIQSLEQELPHAIAVNIEKYEETDKNIKIHALIIVEREGQKRIVIGKNGQVLKKVGTIARKKITRLVEKPVHLELWVKVKSGWQDSEQLLNQFGLDQD